MLDRTNAAMVDRHLAEGIDFATRVMDDVFTALGPPPGWTPDNTAPQPDRPEVTYWESSRSYDLREPSGIPNVHTGRLLGEARPMAPDRWLLRDYTGTDVVDTYVAGRVEALAGLDRIADAWKGRCAMTVEIPESLPAGLDARAVLRYTIHCSHCGQPYRDPESDSPVTWSFDALAKLGDYLDSDDGWQFDLDGRVLACSECACVAWCDECGAEIHAWEPHKDIEHGDEEPVEHVHVRCLTAEPVPVVLRHCNTCGVPEHLWDPRDPLYREGFSTCPGCTRADIYLDQRHERAEL